MKILYTVHQFFPKHYTGTERLVLNLSKQMQRLGHYVKVLTYGISENEGLREDGDFLIKEYEFEGVPVISIKHKLITQEVSFEIFDSAFEKIINRNLVKENFDVIHVCHPMRVGSVIRFGKSHKIPVILTLTDFWLMCPRGIAVTCEGVLCNNPRKSEECTEKCYGVLWKDQLINRYEAAKELFQLVNIVVSGTDFLGKMYENVFPFINVKVIPFGEDYKDVRFNSRKYSNESELTLGFLSTLQPHKGPDVLLEAFDLSKTKNMKLKIYGHYFNEKEYYDRLVKKYNSKYIQFCGEYKYEDLPDILGGLDMIVVPSAWWENSPLVLLKSLVHNVPAIVSDLGGMTEIIKDGINGFTFKAGNAQSLAEKLKLISEDPTILNELKAGIRHPQRIEENAFEYEKLYLRLAEIRGPNQARK